MQSITHDGSVLHVQNLLQAPAVLSQGVTAVIVRGGEPPEWLRTIDDLVTGGVLHIPRTILTSVTPAEVLRWLRVQLVALPRPLAGHLLDDVDKILAAVTGLGISRLLVRVFTEKPTCRCGFHVDTVGPRAPAVGAVKVYNGVGTEYVSPADVVSMAAFYDYLANREWISKLAEAARKGNDLLGIERFEGQLNALDDNPAFLRTGAPIMRTQPGDTVVFRHVRWPRLWTEHPSDEAWIHRSPMAGDQRLVINVSPSTQDASTPHARIRGGLAAVGARG
jgi:hypothetical protein